MGQALSGRAPKIVSEDLQNSALYDNFDRDNTIQFEPVSRVVLPRRSLPPGPDDHIFPTFSSARFTRGRDGPYRSPRPPPTLIRGESPALSFNHGSSASRTKAPVVIQVWPESNASLNSNIEDILSPKELRQAYQAQLASDLKISERVQHSSHASICMPAADVSTRVHSCAHCITRRPLPTGTQAKPKLPIDPFRDWAEVPLQGMPATHRNTRIESRFHSIPRRPLPASAHVKWKLPVNPAIDLTDDIYRVDRTTHDPVVAPHPQASDEKEEPDVWNCQGQSINPYRSVASGREDLVPHHVARADRRRAERQPFISPSERDNLGQGAANSHKRDTGDDRFFPHGTDTDFVVMRERQSAPYINTGTGRFEDLVNSSPGMPARFSRPNTMPLLIQLRDNERQKTRDKDPGMGMFEDSTHANPWTREKAPDLPNPQPLPTPPQEKEQLRRYAESAEPMYPGLGAAVVNFSSDTEQEALRISAHRRVQKRHAGPSINLTRQTATTRPTKKKERAYRYNDEEQNLFQRRKKVEAAQIHHNERGWQDQTPVSKKRSNKLAAQEAKDREFAQRLLQEENGFHYHTAKSPTTSTPRTRDCTVCGETLHPLSFPAKPPTSTCTHPMTACTTCLHHWTATQLENGKNWQSIKCPECPSLLSHAGMRVASSAATFARYDDLCTRATLGAISGFSWCLALNCGSGQENLYSGDGGLLGFMECVKCRYQQCLRHRVAWHDGETCEAYEYRTSGDKSRDEERADQVWLTREAKQCPGRKCGVWIQKTDGCDHMTCNKCKTEFCYICCALYTQIHRIGNGAHKRDCKYHSNNLDS